jgi:hypothetical protein
MMITGKPGIFALALMVIFGGYGLSETLMQFFPLPRFVARFIGIGASFYGLLVMEHHVRHFFRGSNAG